MPSARQPIDRIILAPVGDQLSAVFTPLAACENLRPRETDEVVLIASDKTNDVAATLKRHLMQDGIVTDDRLSVETAGFPRLGEDCLKTLKDRCRNRHVVILANGGPGTWIHELLPQLWKGESPLELMASRGQEGVWFDCRRGTTRRVTVGNIGKKCLLDLLGLEWKDKTGVLKKRRGAQLSGLVALHEHAGELWAAIDAPKYRASTYRINLAFGRLRALGLERRRVCLVDASCSIRERALEDGISVAASKQPRSHQKLRTWTNSVGKGQAGKPSTTVQLPAVPTPSPFQGQAKPPWESGTLVTVMGPQAGTTLTAIWAHKPSRLHVLYDGKQPLAVLAAARLAEDKAVRDHVSAISFGGINRRPGTLLGSIRDALVSVDSHEVLVNLTPGDKLLSLGLYLWALEDPGNRVCWYLEGREAKPILDTGGPLRADPVPLRTWFFLHTPAQVDMARAAYWTGASRPPDPAQRLARATVLWLKRRQDINFLNDLPSRRTGLRLSGGSAWVNGCEFPLQDLSPDEMATAFSTPGGAWLEWVTGVMLSYHGVAEVIVNARDGTSAAVRDEIDVCSLHDGCLTGWECKTKQHHLEDNLFEASSRNTRLFGYRAKTVLLIPCLPAKKPTCFDPVSGIAYLWRHGRGYGYVAAAPLLVNKNDTLKLAGGTVPAR